MSSVASSSWIVSRRDDLTWFIGSSLLGYGLIALAFANGGLPGKIVAGLAFALDGPHVYSTGTRALFDPQERRRQGGLWWLLLPLCIVGPVLTFYFGFTAFFLIIGTLSAYHITKQHMGFVFLYKRKGREKGDYKVDRYFTVGSLMLPYLFYLSAVLTNRTDLLPVFLVPGGLMAVWYVWHQSRKPEVNAPKLMLLAACIPLAWLAWSYAAMDPHSPVRLLAAAVATNIGHSFQYLKLMWFHNRNRYTERAGLLGLVSRKWIYFLAIAVLLSLPNHLAGYAHNDLLSSFMLGFLMFHFVLDSRIWRVRGDAELARALQL